MRQKEKQKKQGAVRMPVWLRTALPLLAILLLCAGLFSWAGYVFLPDSASKSQREIVNDDYAVRTPPLYAGDTLHQTLYAEGRLYGVRLNVATFGEVVRGTLHVALQDENGYTLASSNTDMTQLKDNTFHHFLLDEMVDAGDGTWYTLAVTVLHGQKGQKPVAFWYSDGPAEEYLLPGEEAPHYPLDEFRLEQGGRVLNGTLALQYTVRYAGSFIYRAYAFFAVLLTAFFVVLYLLIAKRKTPLHQLFVLCALVLGFVFSFLIPPRTAPDEYVHITFAYQNANRLLGLAEQGGPGTLTVRAGDEMVLHHYDTGATSIFAYQDMYENLFARAPGGEPVVVPAPMASKQPLVYLPQTAGVVLARLLGLGQVGLLLFGRFANLLFYTLLVSRAIKRMPLAKTMLFSVALLPMCLQLAASFSYDTYVLALCFYFTAYCLECALVKPRLTWRELVVLGLLFVLLIPAKSVYLLVFALVLFIPAHKYLKKQPPKRKLVLAGALAAVCLLGIWVVANRSMLYGAFTGKGVLSPEEYAAVRPNGDSPFLFSIPYMLAHIPQTLKLVLRTLWEQPALWLQGMLGTRLGEVIAIRIEVNWIFGIGLLLALVLSGIPTRNDTMILSKKQRWGAAGIFLLVFAATLAAAITWTPINYTTVFGMQGRYLLPVLPLLLLALRGRLVRLSRPLDAQLAFAMPALVVLCQLDAFLTILTFG